MHVPISNNKKLPELNKRTVAVLTEIEMADVNGGSTPVCISAGYSSLACAILLHKIVVETITSVNY